MSAYRLSFATWGGSRHLVYLHGPHGVIQFMFARYTEPDALVQLSDARLDDGSGLHGYDVGYHSPIPLYEGQEPISGPGECGVLPASSCYYDGSGLAAGRLLERWIQSGSDQTVIDELADEYERHFGVHPTGIALPGGPVLKLALTAKAVTR